MITYTFAIFIFLLILNIIIFGRTSSFHYLPYGDYLKAVIISSIVLSLLGGIATTLLERALTVDHHHNKTKPSIIHQRTWFENAFNRKSLEDTAPADVICKTCWDTNCCPECLNAYPASCPAYCKNGTCPDH